MNLLCDERTGVTLYDLNYDIVYDADDEGKGRATSSAHPRYRPGRDDLDMD